MLWHGDAYKAIAIGYAYSLLGFGCYYKKKGVGVCTVLIPDTGSRIAAPIG